MERLNILILHKMDDPRKWRDAVKEHEYLLPTCEPNHNYIVHASEIPLPPFIKKIHFHGVILGPTFLGHRKNRISYLRILKEYSFLKDSPSFKIALPQDDYNCCAILDDWIIDWKVDDLYSVIEGYHDILYPKYLKLRAIKKGYTSYISEKWIRQWERPKSIEERGIDVSYRASKLPPNFGRIGVIKGVIGDRFIEATRGLGLRLDISTDVKDMIPGSAWSSFVENSKCCLGSNSGSSLIDPRGKIQSAVTRALRKKPTASFEEIEASCFPNEDGKYQLTAISPRNMEAGLAETAQIMTPGKYSNLMEPDRDFILLDERCANIQDVIERMRDRTYRQRITRNCKEKLLGEGSLRATNHAKSLIESIRSCSRIHSIQTISEQQFQSIKNRYENWVSTISKIYWPSRRFYRAIKNR